MLAATVHRVVGMLALLPLDSVLCPGARYPPAACHFPIRTRCPHHLSLSLKIKGVLAFSLPLYFTPMCYIMIISIIITLLLLLFAVQGIELGVWHMQALTTELQAQPISSFFYCFCTASLLEPRHSSGGTLSSMLQVHHPI